MSYFLCVRKDGRPGEHQLQSMQAAIIMAAALIDQGIAVERIEKPDGEVLDAEAVRRLIRTL